MLRPFAFRHSSNMKQNDSAIVNPNLPWAGYAMKVIPETRQDHADRVALPGVPRRHTVQDAICANLAKNKLPMCPTRVAAIIELVLC